MPHRFAARIALGHTSAGKDGQCGKGGAGGKGGATPSEDEVADALIEAPQRAHDDENARGIVHYADEPECTWFDFARAIVGDQATVTPVLSEVFPRPAKRPAYSVLSTERYERITGVKPESWEEGLREYLQQRP